MTRGMEFVCLMCAEGDHGLVQEDQGELTRVCCCAAHINDVRINMHDVTLYTLLHALLQPSRKRTVSLPFKNSLWPTGIMYQLSQT